MLRTIRDRAGWTQEELAARLGTSQHNISRWEKGREPSGPVRDQIRELATEYGLLPPEGIQRTDLIPIIGKVGAGGLVEPAYTDERPEGHSQVEIDDLTVVRPLVAFEVTGDSMLPEYENGDVIVCFESQRRSTDQYINKKAVVMTGDGKRWLKRIARGRRRGTYNLESWNALTIENVEIVWVGEIYATFGPDHVRKVEQAEPA